MTHHDNVSEDECEQIQELVDDGMTSVQIADRLDRATSTVKYHRRRVCSHYSVDSPRIDDEVLIKAVRELAKIKQCIPSRGDWIAWDDAPVVATTISYRFGSWMGFLEAAEFPMIVPAPRQVRALAYQKPELCEVKS